MIGNARHNARHRACVLALADGLTTISAVATRAQYPRAAATASIAYLRSIGIVETVSRPTAAGEQAHYRLVVPIHAALARLPIEHARLTFDALDQALGMPPAVCALLAHPAPARLVDQGWSSAP